jgi:TetR/AcrR family transcriptional regulator, ethionamide resistance regulator
MPPFSALAPVTDASPFSFCDVLAADTRGARKGERTRAALMVALCETLGDGPLSAVTVSLICGRAGVSHGTLYSHFPNRDALVAEALMRFSEFVQARMRDASRGDRGRPERAATGAYVRLFEENLGLMRVLLRDLDGFPQAREAFQALNRDWLGRVAAARARQLEQTGTPIDRDELMRRAYALGGMTDQYLAGLWLDRDPHMLPFSRDREAVIDTLNLLWERGLQP